MKRTLSLPLALGLLLTACGEDSGNGPSGSKNLKDLTTEEAIALCNDVAGTLNGVDLSTFACVATWSALNADGTEAECDSFVDSCLEDESDDDAGVDSDDDNFECDADSAANIKSCDATVSDLKKCYAAYGKLIEQAAESATCANAAKSDDGDDVAETNGLADLPECQAVAPCIEDADDDGGIDEDDAGF